MLKQEKPEGSNKNPVSSVPLLSRVQLFATPLTTGRQASLSITNSWSLLKLMSIKLVMPSNHLILCHPLLLPLIFPRIRVFSHESVLCIRWPKYWSFNFNLSPSNENSGLISFRMDWLGRKMGSTQILTRITVHIDFQFWNHLPCCVQLYTNYWLNDLELLFYVIFSSKHSNQENNFSE